MTENDGREFRHDVPDALMRGERSVIEIAVGVLVDNLACEDGPTGCAEFDALPYQERLRRLDQLLSVLLVPSRERDALLEPESLRVAVAAVYHWVESELLAEIDNDERLADFVAESGNEIESLRSIVSSACENVGQPLLEPDEQREVYRRAVRFLCNRTFSVIDRRVACSTTTVEERVRPHRSPPSSDGGSDLTQLLLRLQQLTSVGR
ncbi:hypothetical protein KOR34_08710 [Posidoniimonas corsicana]|uniref:Uncharacterized protein n=1 Tax=Posidoniimonas corsicana TaxID=1938618 RepID=A0A5C5VBI4_9BACT|nr:hypothetical protein [Posidoniimonas corsicana]TWT35974.1 hypothetical protein KOR34_08710 [Posidoniimonas corsicana]